MKNNSTADQAFVRKLNTAIVLNALRLHTPMSRAGLASFTGLNRSTTSSIINRLIEDGLVRETTFQSEHIGRPGMLLQLNPAGGFAVGIELGVDFISIVVTDFVANVLWRRRIVSNPLDGQGAIHKKAFELTGQALKAGDAHGLRPLGIGLGIPGMVDLRNGTLIFAPNLGWRNIPIRQLWSEQFALPVFVENEANAAAIGEYYFGVCHGLQDFIFLNSGLGLGAGIMVGGKLLHGSQGYASEVGHMIVEPGGDLCHCGKRGCLETLVGPRAVLRHFTQKLEQGIPSTVLHAADHDPAGVTFEMVANAALQGDAAALTAMQEVGANLGLGIANLANIFNPQMVVLGGELNYASKILLPVIKKVVEENALEIASKDLQIKASVHGVDACVMGSAALVLDDILRDPFS